MDTDEIQRQMAAIRRDLDADVDDIVGSMKGITDWREIVGSYPGKVTALAFAVGYMLVPTKRYVIRPGPGHSRELSLDTKRSSAAASVISFIAAAALRSAANSMANYLKEHWRNSGDFLQGSTGKKGTDDH